ncbi:MAG: deoxyribodipyrimidine photo-lyase [Myxococcaceae bacterium]
MAVGFSFQELGVDEARVHVIRAGEPSSTGEYVLYWCQLTQRVPWNHALDAAIALGNHLAKPVVCYHALRPDYPHASDRIHAFVLDGLEELSGAMRAHGIPYWLELPLSPADHPPRLKGLAARSAAVVSDWHPTFVVPRHLAAAAKALEVPLYAVDASCVVPARRIPGAQVGAYALRPKLRKLWPEYLGRLPAAPTPAHASLAARIDPGFIPAEAAARLRLTLERFCIDHSVPPVTGRPGGRAQALEDLRRFVERGLPHFDRARNEPSGQHNSGLSAALHFGLLYAGEVAHAALEAYGPEHPGVASFLEELLVRRELAFNYCLYTPAAQQLRVSSLPPWAQTTLAAHAPDTRKHLYSRDQLERSETHDALWNAAQRQLAVEGRIHGYLRMLWGKKVLEWSPTPQEALDRMAWLNDRFALDGRDAVSVGNFMWVLGLHDRPFQERPVLGKLRPMSSERTAEKVDLGAYLERWGSRDASGFRASGCGPNVEGRGAKR